MKFLKNKKGVTLAELLAVITIMGIIAAIAVPAIGTAIDTARDKQAEGHAIAVFEAARVFCTIEDCSALSSVDSDDGSNLDNYIDGTPGLGVWSVSISNGKPGTATVLITDNVVPATNEVSDLIAATNIVSQFDGSTASVVTNP